MLLKFIVGRFQSEYFMVQSMKLDFGNMQNNKGVFVNFLLEFVTERDQITAPYFKKKSAFVLNIVYL